MAMKLFFSSGSCARASHIALEEAGADYEAVRISLKDGDQRKPEYLKMNPKGRVPLLVVDGKPLTENVAILAYVAQAYPQAKLAPTDPFEFAKMQSINAYLSSTVHVAHAHKGRGSRWSDDPAVVEALKKKVPQNMTDSFALIEREMLQGPWVMGEQYTVADAYLYTLATWLEGDSVDPKQFAKVSDHMRRMAERPAVQRVLAAENA